MIANEPLLKRYQGNPILSPKDVQFEASQIFNAGVVKHHGEYLMAFRNDYNMSPQLFIDWKAGKCELHACSCRIGLAHSQDGLHWKPVDHPVFDIELAAKLTGEKIVRVYDPRLSVVNDEIYMAFATDTESSEQRVGLVRTRDFKDYELITYTLPNNRNMLLFPDKIGGMYYRLERPFNESDGDIWISRSPDLRYWGDHRRLLDRRSLNFCNGKIGPGAPPVRTAAGWLTIFHAVTEVSEALDSWQNPYREWHSKYTFSAMLLDLDDPFRIIGIMDRPLLEPEEEFECKGFRGSVLFPGSLIPEADGSVKLYYGAADTVECVAFGQLDKLIAACLERKKTEPPLI